MKHAIGYGLLITTLSISVVFNLRDTNAGLSLIGGGDGFVEYAHPDSAGLTELIRDENKNGFYEFHAYTVALNDVTKLGINLVLDDKSHLPTSVSLSYLDSRKEQRSVALTMLAAGDDHILHACNVNFLDGVKERETVYTDWNLDGHFDTETNVRENTMKVFYEENWLVAVRGKPYEFLKHVTVLLNGQEKRLDFVSGKFVPAVE